MEKILNKLPAPTFGWLDVNSVKREVKDGERTVSRIDAAAGEPYRTLVEASGAYELDAAAGQNKQVIMCITPKEKAEIATELKIGDGARVKLVQVFGTEAPVINGVKAKLGENAGLEIVQLYIGGKDTVSEINARIDGRRAKLETDIGYLLDGEDRLDINLIAEHRGKKSESRIGVKGVMNGSSQKTFKGTIDFKNGASGAKGAENEEVLLMDETVRNKTVPLILCAEEDVEGSHGASIGRIDEKHVFYMRSRGIPDEKIYELMAASKIAQIVDRIDDGETEKAVNKMLGRSDEEDG